MINVLYSSSSLYLQQHAKQPINWQLWTKESIDLAVIHNKPIFLSIGYSSCHWCHVMSREVFEDSLIAEFINENFVPIKVDREERPDIDQIYTAAVQAMGLQVGWPLNLFLLPNQKPFYAVNYVQLNKWERLLHSVVNAFHNHRQELEKSAESFINTIALHWKSLPAGLHKKIELENVIFWYTYLYQHLDLENGGLMGTPKFPISSLANFLLHYYQLTQNVNAIKSHRLMLLKIAQGGIYDHIGGGFARYTIDALWRVPHFEKMLYDNALLVSMYSYGYCNNKDPLYKNRIIETLDFVKKTMCNNNTGAFYNSVNASSGEQEGDFYLWTQDEIEKILEPDVAKIIINHYNISKQGNWHNGYNVLYADPISNVKNSRLDIEKISNAKQKLYNLRLQRSQPIVDKKFISTHQGMAIVALMDGYFALGGDYYLHSAMRTADFVKNKFILDDNRLLRVYSLDNKQSNEGFLDSYAWIIKAFITLYQATFDNDLIHIANNLLTYVLRNFCDKESKLLYYSPFSDHRLICRSKEIFDNPVPSSNAIMAENLLHLGLMLDNNIYTKLSYDMVTEVRSKLDSEIQYLSHWAIVALYHIIHTPVVTLSGTNATNWAYIIKSNFMNKVIVRLCNDIESTNSLKQNGLLSEDRTSACICIGDMCLKSVGDLEEVVLEIRENISLAVQRQKI